MNENSQVKIPNCPTNWTALWGEERNEQEPPGENPELPEELNHVDDEECDDREPPGQNHELPGEFNLENMEIDEAEMLGAQAMEMDIAQEVEVPFEIDRNIQVQDDFQMAKDLEMAELLMFEMGCDEMRTEPRPKRNKKSKVPLSYVQLICVRCEKKIWRSEMPAEASVGFVCSAKCLKDD